MKRWIVVEWNQASGQPSIVDLGELHWREEDALDSAQDYRDQTARIGRREEYSVHEIELERP